jgi:hypothetical protein
MYVDLALMLGERIEVDSLSIVFLGVDCATYMNLKII